MTTTVGTATSAVAGGTASLTVPPAAAAGDFGIVCLTGDAAPAVTTPGWSLLQSVGATAWYTKLLAATDPGSTVSTSAQHQFAAMAVIRGVNQASPVAASAVASGSGVSQLLAPSPSAGAGGAQVTASWWAASVNYNPSDFIAPPPGFPILYSPANASPGSGYSTLLQAATITPGSSGGGIASDQQSASGTWAALTVVLNANSAPNAPAWLTPNNTAVPYDQDNVLAWRFSDDDPGDSQSAFNLKRWTLDGSGARVGAPVTVYKASPQQQYTLPANTLTLGTKYEFKVDTLDSQGAEGPYSTSLFLTAAASPDGPALTDPTNGQTISTDSYTGVVSVPNADATEWTLYGDNNGVIDTSTIIQGPIVVSTGDIRSHTFTGLANNTPVWWSVRDRYQGLWSQPAQSRTPVTFTPPPVPVVTTMEDSAHGVMVVGIANPLPAGEQPGVAYNNVWIDDADGKGLIRKAVDLPTNTPWTYWLPPSGFDGATVGVIQVEAVGTNGTSSWSVPPTPAPVYEDLDGGTATTAGTDFLDGGSI